MSEADYSPLSLACIRTLGDKTYEKRKVAAIEVEKMSRDFAAVQNWAQIRRLIQVLNKEMITSSQSSVRKGGLAGFASMSIGLGQDIQPFTELMLPPVLGCMTDTDSRVRFYALETLYNISKVARHSIIPMFHDIFLAVGSICTDLDNTTKIGVENLNRLLKDLVLENKNFDVAKFIDSLLVRIYASDPFSRSFHINWIDALWKLPNANLVTHLPLILDGIFNMLGDKNQDIYTKAKSVLGEFLASIKEKPENVNYVVMTQKLVVHLKAKSYRMGFSAIFWIREFLHLSGASLLPQMSGIVAGILPNQFLSDDDRRSADDHIKEIVKMSKEVNKDLLKLVGNSNEDSLDLTNLVYTLLEFLQTARIDEKSAVLNWFCLLYKTQSPQMIKHTDKIFPHLLETLSEQSDEVVILDLHVLAEVCISSPDLNKETYFRECIKHLLNLFKKDKILLDAKGYYIVRQLCLLLNPEDIFKCLAEFIAIEEDLSYASQMVDELHMILLTAPELATIRTKLRRLETKDECELFVCIYKCWCHSPTAAVGLCIFSGCFSHSTTLLKAVQQQPMTVEMLMALEKLVQMIESPIFGEIRMQLLKVDENQDLLDALYTLLMIMPHSKGCAALSERLQKIPALPPNSVKAEKTPRVYGKDIEFPELVQHFQKILSLHWKDSEGSRVEYLRSKGIKIANLTHPLL